MKFIILSHGVMLVHDHHVVITLSLEEWTALQRPPVPESLFDHDDAEAM